MKDKDGERGGQLREGRGGEKRGCMWLLVSQNETPTDLPATTSLLPLPPQSEGEEKRSHKVEVV